MQSQKGIVHALYQNLSSMRLTVSLFLIVAVSSILGTLLPQGSTLEQLQRDYSPTLSWWIDLLGMNDLYRTGWFRTLLLLLCLNLVVCTIQRLPKTLKLLFHRDETISPDKLEKFNCHTVIATNLPLEATEVRINKIVAEEFAPLHSLPSSDAFRAVAERGRWSRLMVYIIHFSVLVILLGALLGSVFGFKGFMNLAEGEASDQVLLARGMKTILLPFQVRCDDFAVSFYDTGAPKEYRSDLTILDNGHEVLTQSIRVNDPLSFQGVTFYQATYGSIPKRLEVELREQDTGTIQKLTLPYRKAVTIPGTQHELEVVEYQENLSSFGQAAAIVLLSQNREPSGSWVLIDMPEFHGNRIQNYRIKVLDLEKTHFTGLQVKRDPGVWFVYIGFIVMLTGIAMTFYSSHRKLWVWASPEINGSHSTSVIIAGKANKNSLAFEQEFNQLCARLRDDLNPK